LIYVFVILIVSLVVISACEQYVGREIDKKINSNLITNQKNNEVGRGEPIINEQEQLNLGGGDFKNKWWYI